jgi:hypothetical protein
MSHQKQPAFKDIVVANTKGPQGLVGTGVYIAGGGACVGGGGVALYFGAAVAGPVAIGVGVTLLVGGVLYYCACNPDKKAARIEELRCHLGLPTADCTPEAIHSTYRRLARGVHPDRHPADKKDEMTAKYQELQNDYREYCVLRGWEDADGKSLVTAHPPSIKSISTDEWIKGFRS